MRPHASYIICTTARTGSSFLCEALWNTGLAGKPDEFFNQKTEKEYTKTLGVFGYSRYLDRIVDTMMTPNGIFGVKVMWHQFARFTKKVTKINRYKNRKIFNVINETFPNPKHIWLIRRDKIRQSVSLWKGSQTKIYNWFDAKPPEYAKTLKFNLRAIDKLIHRLYEEDGYWKDYFSTFGIQPLKLVYEEDVESDCNIAVKKIFNYLTIPIPDNLPLQAQRKKLSDDLTEEFVNRYNSEKITILMPCKDQKKKFLEDAIDSVIKQTSPHWFLFIIVDQDIPEKTKDVIRAYLKDPRIQMFTSERPSMASALNTGMQQAATEFVCILLSDDKLDKKAIRLLKRYIKKYPKIDFFHSSRKYIDSKGRKRGRVMRSKESFEVDHFKKYGSPVKHLLCWRREKGLAIGGMDEELTLHGCDDYDFPWKMAEAGSKFKAIQRCLYYYRIHHDFYRLTTHISLDKQAEIVKKRFKKHGVSESETNTYVDRALKGYILKDKMLSYEKEKPNPINLSYYREISEKRVDEFFDKGYKKRHFFPHRIYYLPRCGPDGLKEAIRMCKINNPNKLREIVLYAVSPDIDEFPRGLFFDNDIVWHKQQLGKAGQIATANIAIKGNELYGNNYLSDIVQRISRKREYKTRIENKFEGWTYMLINSIMNFALEHNIKRIYSPTSDWAVAHTDQTRKVERGLFDRIYDRTIHEHFSVKKHDGWWVINVAENLDKIIMPEKKEEIVEYGKSICICHDIEKGLGHLDIDPELGKLADENFKNTLEKMLSIEKEMDVKTTYNVLGCLFNEVRENIERNGHSIAFHSYDHGYKKQLARCRQIDYRIKGYRPPRSKITAELNDRNLCYHNFEWLVSSAYSLRRKNLKMQNGIIKIPILFDDFPLYKDRIKYEDWEEKAIDMVKQNYFVAFCLHDCYAQYWLPHYREFLETVKKLGNIKTLDQAANEIILANAR